MASNIGFFAVHMMTCLERGILRIGFRLEVSALGSSRILSYRHGRRNRSRH